jgi:hypothetical protein
MKFSHFIEMPKYQLKEAENILNNIIKNYIEESDYINNDFSIDYEVIINDSDHEYGLLLYKNGFISIIVLKNIIENIIETLKIENPSIVSWAYCSDTKPIQDNVFSGGGFIKKLGHEIIEIDVNEYLKQKLEELEK